MRCCDELKNRRLYAAQTPTGQATYCRECGRAWPAARTEIDQVSGLSRPSAE